MRRLLENLAPDSRPIYWKLVGGMFGHSGMGWLYIGAR